MTHILSFFQSTKNKLLDFWDEWVDSIYENPRKIITHMVIGLICSCILAILMVTSQAKIRGATIDKMAFENLPSEKIQSLAYQNADKEILNKKAVSVMFSKPHGKELNEVFQLLKNRDDELNRPFYYYPIVYDTNDLMTNYQVDPNEVTLIFYENGQEKNRFLFSDLKDPSQEFLPELNRLPMWNIKEMSQE